MSHLLWPSSQTVPAAQTRGHISRFVGPVLPASLHPVACASQVASHGLRQRAISWLCRSARRTFVFCDTSLLDARTAFTMIVPKEDSQRMLGRRE